MLEIEFVVDDEFMVGVLVGGVVGVVFVEEVVDVELYVVVEVVIGFLVVVDVGFEKIVGVVGDCIVVVIYDGVKVVFVRCVVDDIVDWVIWEWELIVGYGLVDNGVERRGGRIGVVVCDEGVVVGVGGVGFVGVFVVSG